ncbi:MAG: SCO family protein [bacterium]|nr:SCO family protein [bacterium]
MSAGRKALLWAFLGTVLCGAGVGIGPAEAQPTAPPKVGLPAGQVPEQLRGIGFEQRLGEPIPLDLELVDAAGRTILLGDRLSERPALLVPVYYDCPMLCGLVLEALSKSLRVLSLEVGRDFDVVVFSFDSTEGHELAAKTRKRILRYFDSEAGWSFLVGSDESIRRLTTSIGYTAKRDQKSGEMAHAAGLFVLTPEGRIARVFFGIDYPPRDLRLALVEAGEGTIGGFVDQVLLFCFRYDPATGRYSTAILRIVRVGGMLTALAVAAFVYLARRRERVHSPNTTAGSAEGTA